MNPQDRSDSRLEYYRRRAAQERALAERTVDPSARCAHVELAKRYAEMVLTIPA